MKFEVGHKKLGGKQVGTLNKRTAEAIAILEKNNFCPISALIECYQEARKIYDNYGVIYDAICDAREEQARQKGYTNVPPEDKADKYLRIAADTAKDLASYAFPKLKAVEQHKTNPTEGMSLEQKRDAARIMLQVLEEQIKNEPGSGTPPSP